MKPPQTIERPPRTALRGLRRRSRLSALVVGLILVTAGGAGTACGDDEAAADPGSLDSCESVADAAIDLIQDNLDFTDGLSQEEMAALGNSEEMPEELQATQEAGAALEARSIQLGCAPEEMNALVAARADRLTADGELGLLIIENIRAGEDAYFGEPAPPPLEALDQTDRWGLTTIDLPGTVEETAAVFEAMPIEVAGFTRVDEGGGEHLVDYGAGGPSLIFMGAEHLFGMDGQQVTPAEFLSLVAGSGELDITGGVLQGDVVWIHGSGQADDEAEYVLMCGEPEGDALFAFTAGSRQDLDAVVEAFVEAAGE